MNFFERKNSKIKSKQFIMIEDIPSILKSKQKRTKHKKKVKKYIIIDQM